MRAIAIFTIGAMVGTTFGFLLAALCRVAARTDRAIAREEREEVERMRLSVVSDAGVGLQPSQENHADGVPVADPAARGQPIRRYSSSASRT
jgi:hypothetical protein